MRLGRQIIKQWPYVVSTALIIAGISYLSFTNETHAGEAPFIVPAPTTNSPTYTQKEKAPVRLVISAVHIDLEVKAGNFHQATGKWDIDSESAFFATHTATPLIYGHNITAIFEPLSKVAKGDKLTLEYADGTKKDFSYSGTLFVKPDDASVLTEHDLNTVILLTCSGLFSDSRRLVYFEAQQ